MSLFISFFTDGNKFLSGLYSAEVAIALVRQETPMQLRLKKAVDLSVLSMTEPAGKKARKLLPLTTKTH